MQRLYVSPWTPEEYIASEAHRQIVPESTCPICQRAVTLHRHGAYLRWLATVLGELLRLWIARFLCPRCRHTVSYLPDFAFTYRVLQPDTFAAFLEGESARPDVRTFWDLLHGYQRRFQAFGAELIRTVGPGLGVAPPPSSRGLWPWLRKAGEGLRPLTRRLVTDFKIGLFKRYHCHQPAGP